MIATKLDSRWAGSEQAGSKFTVDVVFTDVASTLNSLKRAAALASELGASLRIVAPVIVPYPLPLDRPPVNYNTLHRSVSTLTSNRAIPTKIDLIYCRDRTEGIIRSIKPGSVVIMSWRRRWIFDANDRLAKHLRRNGRTVITP